MAAQRNDRSRAGSADDPLPSSRGVVSRASGGDLGPIGHLGHRDIPPGPAGARACRGIGCDDDDDSAPLGTYLGQRRLEFDKVGTLRE